MRYLNLILIVLFTVSEVLGQEVEKKLKYVNHTEFGGLVGRVKYSYYAGGEQQVTSKQSITAQTFNGVRLNDRLVTGVVVGMDWYKTALINPIAAGIRYDLTKGQAASLYTTADVGYGFAWFHDDTDGFDTSGGLMFNPGIGLRYGKPGGAAFTIGLSYKSQYVHVDKPQWNSIERYEKRVYNRLALRLGMQF